MYGIRVYVYGPLQRGTRAIRIVIRLYYSSVGQSETGGHKEYVVYWVFVSWLLSVVSSELHSSDRMGRQRKKDQRPSLSRWSFFPCRPILSELWSSLLTTICSPEMGNCYRKQITCDVCVVSRGKHQCASQWYHYDGLLPLTGAEFLLQI